MFAVFPHYFLSKPWCPPTDTSENGFICGIARVTLFIQQHAGLGSNLSLHQVSLRKSLINEWIAELSHLYLSSFQQMCCVTILQS